MRERHPWQRPASRHAATALGARGWIGAAAAAAFLVLAAAGAGTRAVSQETPTPFRLRTFETAAFSLGVPEGWEVVVSGVCSTLSVVARDPERPLRQILFVASLGPVYASEAQKRIDARHLSGRGEAIPWFEMPVVEPLRPEAFLHRYPVIVTTGLIRSSRRGLPSLRHLRVVASTPRPSRLDSGRGRAALTRVVFVGDAEVGQGQVAATVVSLLPYTGEPGEGIGYGVRIAGITAEEPAFPSLRGELTRALASFRVRQEYAARCRGLRHQAFDRNVLEPGRFLRPLALEMIDVWEARDPEEDRRVRELADSFRNSTDR